MRRSRIYLPDVNVWVALASERHIHSRIAAAWLESIGDQQAAFCRITQRGFLRLMTNSQVMGPDVLTPAEAWKAYRRLSLDSRIGFLAEPTAVEAAWQELTSTRQSASNVWTDAYLQAFARLSGARAVSFDRGFSKFDEPEPVILGA